MSTVVELVSDLHSRGVVLSLEGERLRCDAPKGVITAEIHAELTARKPEVVAFLRELAELRKAEVDPGSNELPLSHSQRRLWFIEKLDPGNPVYHMAVAIHMEGPLDAQALEKALHFLVVRHESLRSGFEEKNGQPFAQLRSAAGWRPAFTDLSGLPLEEAEKEATRLAIEAARKPFSLGQPPLFRAGLYRLNDERHLLLMVLHHIIADGWSMGVLAREIGVAYADLNEGRAPSLPALPMQFQDYVRWKAEGARQAAEMHLSYWRERLHGPLPVLQFPGKRRPAVPTFRGHRISMVIEPSLAESIRELCRRHDATPFMFLLAAFEVLLYRYTGQADLLVGTGNSNRPRAEFSPLVGFFVENLVLRSDLSDNPTFRDFLGQIREVARDAYAHQDLPFDMLMKELQPERDLSRNPVFQTAFVMQNVPLEPIGLPGLSIEARPLDIGISPLDLSMGVWVEGGGYRCDLEYSTDLFDEEFAVALQSHYGNLLREVARDLEQRIDSINFLSAEERRRLLVAWNNTERPYPQLPVHRIFEEVAAAQPDNAALIFAGGRLSYAELDRLANAIAAWLAARHMPSHSFIAVCAPGDPLGIAAFLGILKAGHAWFPITASDPAQRLKQMIESAGTAIVLATRAYADQLAALGVRGIASLEEVAASCCNGFPAAAVGPDDPACLLFTSGSTGEPKGVVIPHRGIVRLVRETDYIRFASDEVFLQTSALTFDASTPEIWGALLNGARLVLLEAEHPSAEEIGRAIRDHRVTTVFTTAALFHYFVAEHLEAIAPLRQINVGGDVLSPKHAARLLERAPHIHLVNAYGPTENSTITSAHKLRRADLDGSSVPIGRPIANTRVFLLDKQLQPVTAGAVGELFVAGDGLACGYLNAPVLTSQAFVTLHWEEVGEVRAYRTGDLATYRSDGVLEFLGRSDRQIKLHGYRIEPAEVEEAILSLDGIQEAVVSTRAWPDGDRKLVAYMVRDRGFHDDQRALHLHLRRVLPRPRIPACIVFVDEMPRTPNGKTDYAALDALPLPSGTGKQHVRGPLTATEATLIATFRDLLLIESVSVQDDFFALGGHSLLAMQLLSRIRISFGADLTVATIFQNPTVEMLAPCIEAAGSATASMAEEGAERKSHPAVNEHRLSRAQRRLWFLDQLDPGNAAYNIAIPLHLEGPLRRDALEQALQSILRRHESLRTRFPEREGAPYAVVDTLEGWIPAFFDISGGPAKKQEEELTRLLSAEIQMPYSLAAGPLFRASLYKKGDRDHLLLLAMHHIISDGWSIGILARELGLLYEAHAKALPSPLPPLPVQFRDYVQWEEEQETQSSGGDLAYWRKQLSGELPQLELPLDRPRPAVQTFRGRRVFADLPAELEEQLQQVARHHNATLFMVLLAGFGVLLRHYTHQDDILIGTPTAGRIKSSFEGLIGLFVNNLVLRLDLGGEPCFAELLGRVRTTTLEGLEHQSTAFDQLVELLQPERAVNRSPFFQVLFTLQNNATPQVRFDELEMSARDVERSQARYDLAIDVYRYECGYRCNFEYNTDIFEEATVRQMLRHYVRILELVCADPWKPVTRLGLLQESERRQLLEEWNCTDTSSVAHATVHAWFQEQARRNPTAPAVQMGRRTLTYLELDRESDRLAKALRSRGIQRESIVGIYLQRSPEMVIGMLGILKAGGAYLPLDPALPPQRIEFLLADADVSLILADRESSDTLPKSATPLVKIDDPILATDEPWKDEGAGDDRAYLIYTSGSTGSPKGTEITHASLINLLASMLKEPGLTAEDTLAAVTTLSFDIAGLEILGPLLCGAKLVLASREEAINPELLSSLLDGCGATVMQATPSSWRMLIDSGWMGRPNLRMWCGGEALSPDLAESLTARGGGLWNLYGPTETTIWSAVHRVRPGENPIPIGRPIANTRMYILDENQQPVPIGVTGELCIGGKGVARGYWRRPELTASRFLPDPFDSSGVGRIYRTGDLARYRQDGRIQILGRMDHQIKLRGHRIEPGEIEAILGIHPSIRQAVVVAWGEGAAKQLVAYVRYALDPVEPGQLRSWLQERLPDFMVPAQLIALEEIPLTPNGKVDRKLLPSPESASPERAGRSLPPRNGTEERLARLWSEILRVERPGVRENFFDLGGHSLLLVQFHARLKREFRTEIALVDLFRHSTIETLATFLDRETGIASSPVGAGI